VIARDLPPADLALAATWLAIAVAAVIALGALLLTHGLDIPRDEPVPPTRCEGSVG
jgi:hypothetical protein